ncbi:hypothetical protein LCGC14_2420900 [marine sediment metagenome]|uniref:SprT-like domain-containing protein n=1 Tax=marine sediment metagenome TaxID=412755 RepID=A0A0F9BPS8_9ZZZZ
MKTTAAKRAYMVTYNRRRQEERRLEMAGPLQHVADVTAGLLGLVRSPKVVIRPKLRHGTAYRVDGYLTLPGWAMQRSAMYAVAYAVHETCHFVAHGHGSLFRKTEREALQAWGIIAVKYGAVYCTHFETRFGHALNQFGLRPEAGGISGWNSTRTW